MDDKLSKALDLIPMGPGEFKAPVTTNPQDKDYEYARQNVYGLLEKGHSALEELHQLAMSTQHPSAFRALSEMISTLTKANKDLLELQKWSQEIEDKAKEKDTRESTGNKITNVFIGSTAQLQELIANARKKDEE